MPLNPGFKLITMANKDDRDCNPGQTFTCPACRRIILEATAERFRTRCKCGRWIYAEKTSPSVEKRLDVDRQQSDAASKIKEAHHVG